METFLKVIAAVGVFTLLVAIYIGTYILNKKTKKPEGCHDLTGSCTGCAITSCAHNNEEGEN